MGEGKAVTRHAWSPPAPARPPGQPGYPEPPPPPGHNVEGLSHDTSEGGEGSGPLPTAALRPPRALPGERRARPAWGAQPHRPPQHRVALDLQAERGRPAGQPPPPPRVSAEDRKLQPFPGGAQPW